VELIILKLIFMKLTEFNASNSSAVRPERPPVIRVNKRAGLISLSKAAVELLGVSVGNGVVFLQDEDSPRDWFICKSNTDVSFVLRTSDKKKQFDFNSSVLAKKILSSLQVREEYISCGFMIQKKAVEIDGQKYFLIITAKPIKPKITNK
jgi:hypothetical protein